MAKKVPVTKKAMAARLDKVMETLLQLNEEVQEVYAALSRSRKLVKHWENKYYTLHTDYARGKKEEVKHDGE